MQLAVIENENFGFLLSTKDVALGYGVSESAIRSQKSNNKDDFKEGKHFILEYNEKNLPKVMWTQKGIVRLGFFIKSKKAREFRDWAEDYITKAPTNLIDGKNPQAIIRGLKSQQSQQKKKIELLESNIETLISENSTLALPAPTIERYEENSKRQIETINKLTHARNHFDRMAGVQLFKTMELLGMVDDLNNEKIYNTIGNFIRRCRIIKKDADENVQNVRIERV